MADLSTLKSHTDDNGNRVIYEGPVLPKAVVRIVFRGRNNTVRVGDSAKIVHLTASFEGDNAVLDIASTTARRTGLRFNVRLGHDTSISIGENVGSQSPTFIRVSEGQSVRIGDDCMLSSNIEIRADDSHAIYDVRTARRVNPARGVTIGNHVWIGRHVALMAGAEVCDGSVVGFRSIVTRRIPNNCVAVGSPARVVRRNIAWERPGLTKRMPGVEGVPEGEKRSDAWWTLTEEEVHPQIESKRRSLFSWLRRNR